MTTRRSLVLGALAAVAGPPFAIRHAAAQQPPDIGVASAVVNRVSGSSGGRSLKPGDRIYQNERIETADDARGQLLFRDETVLSIGPSATVTLDRFVYDPARGATGAAVNVARGALRFISGNMPSQAYEIRTPAGSIGVRGTIFDLIVYDDGEVVIRLVQGALTATLNGASIGLDRIGQVLLFRLAQAAQSLNGLRPRDKRRLTGIGQAGQQEDYLDRDPSRDIRRDRFNGREEQEFFFPVGPGPTF